MHDTYLLSSGRRLAATRGGVDGAWPPRGGCALALVGTASGNGHGATRSRPDAALGWAERGARERRALLQAGPASAVGREAERRPAK